MSNHLSPMLQLQDDGHAKTTSLRRTAINTPWAFGMLLMLLGGVALLPTSKREGGRMGFIAKIVMPGSELEVGPDMNAAQSHSNTTSSDPGRVFRNTDEKRYETRSRGHSMYEKLWPGYKLPWWAHKVRRFRGFHPPKGNDICFVHVGKTAGSSIGCALGFRLHCGDNKQYLPGRLPKSAARAFHKDVYDCPVSTDFYLFVVRDPLARFRSAFVYGRPDEYGHTKEGKHWEFVKQLYIDCPTFSTANNLAATGLTEDGEASDECKQRAKDLVRGTAQYEDHIFYNYQYYLAGVPHKSNLLVIRTEHMEEDWNSIEKGLGGAPRTNITFPHENSRPKQERDLILGDEKRMLLCHELCVEIQTYKLLLRSALNVDDDQYEKSMEELQHSCPNEATAKQCDFHTPNIKQKLLDNRGYPPRPQGRKLVENEKSLWPQDVW